MSHKCGIICVRVCVNISVPTCSLILLMPSGPSRLTACLTRSVRPQLSIRNPRSCRNFASVDAASSFRVAQKQSSALLNKRTVQSPVTHLQTRNTTYFLFVLHLVSNLIILFFYILFYNNIYNRAVIFCHTN